MRTKRLRLLKIIAATGVMFFGLWLVQHVRERHKAAEREAYYQTILAKYTSELKPGMSREQVEQRIQSDGKRFGQMCCVANIRGQYTSSVEAGWDDLVKIGEESPLVLQREQRVHCL
jgi:hypothetical protein